MKLKIVILGTNFTPWPNLLLASFPLISLPPDFFTQGFSYMYDPGSLSENYSGTREGIKKYVKYF